MFNRGPLALRDMAGEVVIARCRPSEAVHQAGLPFRLAVERNVLGPWLPPAAVALQAFKCSVVVQRFGAPGALHGSEVELAYRLRPTLVLPSGWRFFQGGGRRQSGCGRLPATFVFRGADEPPPLAGTVGRRKRLALCRICLLACPAAARSDLLINPGRRGRRAGLQRLFHPSPPLLQVGRQTNASTGAYWITLAM